MKPALTAEEWETQTHEVGYLDPGLTVAPEDGGYGVNVPQKYRHALAALALYGQPFGFSREMVDALALAVEVYEGYEGRDSVVTDGEAAIANIKALLPPEDLVK